VEQEGGRIREGLVVQTTDRCYGTRVVARGRVGPIRVDTTTRTAEKILLFPMEYYFNYLLCSGTSVKHVLYMYDISETSNK